MIDPKIKFRVSFLLTLFSLIGFNFQEITAQIAISADVHINTEKSVEGVSNFDRDVFINLHSGHNTNDWETWELDDIVNNTRINFGRSVGGVTWQMNKVEQDPNRPGFFDINHMKTLGQQSRNSYSNKTSIHQYESETFVMTSHISPLFPDGTNTNEGWSPANFESVGQFYAHFLKEYYGGNGEPRPNYVEVINEPMVHLDDLNTTNVEMSEFHNVVADSIHFHNPDVQVGGYTAAWPEFERNNFAIWEQTWRTFIDVAGSKMDFFSFHLYDTPVPGDEAQRKGSNVEAIFDMIEQYSFLSLGEVRPMLISEYGACCADWDGPYYPERDWLQLKSVSSMTMSMMERPHKMLKAIPFITDKSVWYLNANGYPYPHVMLENLNGGFLWEYTHLKKYYDLWRDVEGTRVYTQTHDPDLQIDAYVKDNKAYVIFNNLEHEEVDVSLDLFENTGNELQGVYIKHLHSIADIPVLLETEEVDAIIDLNQAEDEVKYYSNKYLQEINASEPIVFTISDVNKSSFGEAVIRVGLGRAHGKSLHPSVKINGTDLDVPTDWRGYDQNNRADFFGLLEIPVPYELLQNNNNYVTVKINDAGGFVSTVTMQVKNLDYNPMTTSTSNPDQTPDWAKDLVLSPNPTQNSVQFRGLGDVENVEVSIFSMDGKKVVQDEISRGDNIINLESLPSGMYQVQLRVKDGVVMKKLVKM